MLASLAYFKNRGSELLPMLLIASLAFSFLIAICINTMRFHEVIVQHNLIFSLVVFALGMQKLAGKHLILPPRADNFLQIKTPSAVVPWEKPDKRPAYSRAACSSQAARLSWVRRKHPASKGTVKRCSHLEQALFRLSTDLQE